MYDDDGGLWLTSEGVAEVRTRLIRRTLTQMQKLLGKDRKTAEKFTGRHTPDIQAAARRGETLRNITTALLGENVLQELRQLQEDRDT